MSKYKRKCVDCTKFVPSGSFPDDVTYGTCRLSGSYAENERTSYGRCKERGKHWVAKSTEIELEEIEANKPWWKKLLVD